LRIIKTISVTFLFLLLLCADLIAADIFVPGDYGKIQDAIDAGYAGDVIKVAGGKYEESISFVLTDDIRIQGGYSADFSVRNPFIYVTTIDGGQIDSTILLLYDTSTLIDGFSITNGKSASSGGGINCLYSTGATISNNIIENNTAVDFGGGIFCTESNPQISNNIIRNNLADGGGGGIATQESSAVIENNYLHDNYSEFGGGIFCNALGPTIVNNVISMNRGIFGGGILCLQSNPDISNSILSGNTAINYGGAIYCFESSPIITNCAMVRNITKSHGSVFVTESSSPIISNSIFWQNGDDLIFNINANPQVSYSNISDPRFEDANGNFSTNPLFMDIESGNYQLLTNSPCINAGNPLPEYFDPDGSVNDLGAYGGLNADTWSNNIQDVPVPYTEDTAWNDLGLYGGQITASAIDPVDTEKMFATSFMGDGLFVTRDKGDTWQSVEGFRNMECFDVIIDTQNTNRVWIVYFDSVAKSIDGGSKWAKWQLPDRRSARAITMHPTMTDTLYIGAGGPDSSHLNGTVFKTTNGGQTWQQSSLNLDKTVVFLTINKSIPDELWALTGYNEPGSVYKSSDAGSNWTKIDIGQQSEQVKQIVIHPDEPQTLYLSGTFGVLKTTDGGINWIDTGITEPCWALGLKPQTPSVIYSATYDVDQRYAYRSADNGATWIEYPLDSIRGFIHFSIDVNPPHHLYGGSLYSGIHLSEDEGENWQALNTGIKANTVNDSVIDENNPAIILSGTVAGVYRGDQESNWTRLTNGTSYAVAYDPTDSDIIYSGEEYVLNKTTDGGNNWDPAYLIETKNNYIVSSIALDPQNTQNLHVGLFYRTGNDGGVYSSQDGGITFSPRIVFNVPANVVALDPNNSQIIYAGTGMFYASSYDKKGGIYRSTDGGDIWSEQLLTDVVVNTIQVDPGNSDVIYAGCGDSSGTTNRGFFKSSDGGQTWQNLEFVTDAVTEIKIDQLNSNRLFAATYSQGVFMSIDAGENWINIGLSNYLMQDLSTYKAASPSATALSMYEIFGTENSTRQLYAGTDSGIASFTGSSISGHIYDNTGSGIVYPESIQLEMLNAQIKASIFDTGTYFILGPPVGDNYTLQCQAPGYLFTEISDISVWAMAELEYDFYLHTDSDNDGLSDEMEISIGTNPNNADTDNDGLLDGVEDANQNGILDPGETNPNDADTDNDGTNDNMDSCPNDPNKTNPGTCGCGIPDTDSDNDGVPDCDDDTGDGGSGDGGGNGGGGGGGCFLVTTRL